MAPRWFRRFSSSAVISRPTSGSNPSGFHAAPPSTRCAAVVTASGEVCTFISELQKGGTSADSPSLSSPRVIPSNRPFSLYSETSMTETDASYGSSAPVIRTIKDSACQSDAEIQTDVFAYGCMAGEMEIFKMECQQAVSRAEDELKCVICLHNSRGIMFSPCHHVITCESCANELPLCGGLIASTRLCPFCRKGISKMTKVYLSWVEW